MTVMDACGKAGALCAFAAAMWWLKVACVVTPTRAATVERLGTSGQQFW